jgi:transposase
MKTEYHIALDVHVSFCEMAVVTGSGKVVARSRCGTSIPALVQMIDEVRRPRHLTFEEGPLADWLARNLREHVNELVVCEPRRNRLIAKDGDKDDDIDAEKLAHLYRGGYLKSVHQSESLDRSLLKQAVGYYHHCVRERVRQGNQLVAQLRRHGVFVPAPSLVDTENWREVAEGLPKSMVLHKNINQKLAMYCLLREQELENRQMLVQLARRENVVRRFTQIPGVGWIRAVTFYVYVDTPFRFRSKSALWRYCGIGMKRKHSGKGRTRTELDHTGNRRLKDVLLGAAKSAIASKDSPYADKYDQWRKSTKTHPSTARRNVARSIATTMLMLWKSGESYDASLVH